MDEVMRLIKTDNNKGNKTKNNVREPIGRSRIRLNNQLERDLDRKGTSWKK